MEIVTPESVASPHGAPSPKTQAIKKSLMIDRARMFAQGQHEKLLKVLNGEERRYFRAIMTSCAADIFVGYFLTGCTNTGSSASKLQNIGEKDR
jgi:hypothetical protein